MRSRREAESLISALYGVSASENGTAAELLTRLMEEMGTAALTDEAMNRLAGMQEDFHEMECRRMEAAWRREQRGY